MDQRTGDWLLKRLAALKDAAQAPPAARFRKPGEGKLFAMPKLALPIPAWSRTTLVQRSSPGIGGNFVLAEYSLSRRVLWIQPEGSLEMWASINQETANGLGWHLGGFGNTAPPFMVNIMEHRSMVFGPWYGRTNGAGNIHVIEVWE